MGWPEAWLWAELLQHEWGETDDGVFTAEQLAQVRDRAWAAGLPDSETAPLWARHAGDMEPYSPSLWSIVRGICDADTE